MSVDGAERTKLQRKSWSGNSPLGGWTVNPRGGLTKALQDKELEQSTRASPPLLYVNNSGQHNLWTDNLVNDCRHCWSSITYAEYVDGTFRFMMFYYTSVHSHDQEISTMDLDSGLILHP